MKETHQKAKENHQLVDNLHEKFTLFDQSTEKDILKRKPFPIYSLPRLCSSYSLPLLVREQLDALERWKQFERAASRGNSPKKPVPSKDSPLPPAPREEEDNEGGEQDDKENEQEPGDDTPISLEAWHEQQELLVKCATQIELLREVNEKLTNNFVELSENQQELQEKQQHQLAQCESLPFSIPLPSILTPILLPLR